VSVDPPDNGHSADPPEHPAVTYEPGWIAPPPGPVRPERKQIVLFLLTCITTTLAGTQASPVFYARYAGQDIHWQDLFLPENLVLGIPFSVTLLLILGIHEMGHFYAARRWHVRATLPYFIPIPTIIGTMGAIIRIRSRIPNRRALFDIGVAGPLAGFVIAVFALAYGFSTAKIVSMSHFEGQGALVFGDSLLTSALQYLMVGEIPSGHDLMLDPVGFAGWLGLFVTVLNLLPIGQFDGGHLRLSDGRDLYRLLHPQPDPVGRAVVVAFQATVHFISAIPSTNNQSHRIVQRQYGKTTHEEIHIAKEHRDLQGQPRPDGQEASWDLIDPALAGGWCVDHDLSDRRRLPVAPLPATLRRSPTCSFNSVQHLARWPWRRCRFRRHDVTPLGRYPGRPGRT
jgi:Zn-dependent protease